MYRFRYTMIGILLLLFVSVPYVRLMLEASMVATMLIQIPLLVVSGYFLAKGFPKKWQTFFLFFNGNGIAGILITLFILTYWSLPRSIDAALNDPLMEFAKYISLPFLAGLFLYYSWQLLGPISKAFIWANMISMIFVMSWLYLASPARLCNNYLVTEQQELGKAMFILGMGICIVFMGRVFIGKPMFNVIRKKDKKSYLKMNVKSRDLDERLI
ncbi:hypothetical protein [Bacillus sp. REN16]|uniref:hypothetical protein n=1 Tax=Bacillus sp. REN16 TaxID=2887296 RepID=UPI001E54D6DE|nr:hypothetical protein [Bacillus sp. REN16]MCC3355580.1 hypothetical protein [Bacillus sp. REN16]